MIYHRKMTPPVDIEMDSPLGCPLLEMTKDGDTLLEMTRNHSLGLPLAGAVARLRD
ncbi:hypothetical protein G1C94_1329 [Bifidobacterium sp. DSM 109963]|uniref:Transcriptional regulator n=1 Tax=Bifidobacterium panos TaxID=2675321 RepID=A0ABX1T108_9BIFI|nr:hypothetical protein [Bifidobacterium sp. DSM 109963]